MSYQVIARKYRPQRFEDVVGQEHVTQTLANAIAQKRIAHAYLFVGPRGTGKTTLARIFAKCLNSTNGPTVDFPDDDPRVKEITEGRSIDVLEIDGASNRGIDEVRELRETVKYAPAASRFKIYIIDEVHMLTKEAFNALLKTLEEPPAHVKFMFATTEPEKVLPTILSRCQRFDLRRIPTALIVEHLAKIAVQEGVKIDGAALHAIARGADGGMRDAESALEQLISFCSTEIAESDVLSMFGLASQGQILALSQAVLAGETETALRQLNDLAHQGKDLARLVAELLQHFRNLLIFQVSKGDLKLVEASEAESASLGEQAKQVKPDALARIMEVLTDCEWRLRDTASRKILLEISLLKMIEARHAVSIDTVLSQLKELRAEAAGNRPAAAPKQSAPTPRPATSAPHSASASQPPGTTAPSVRPAERPQTAAPVAPVTHVPAGAAMPAPGPGALSETDLAALWIQFTEAIKRVRPFVYAYYNCAHPVSLEKNVLTIGFDPEFADQIQLVNSPMNRELAHTKLSELGYPHVQVKFIQHEGPPVVSSAPEPAPVAAPVAAAVSSQAPPSAPAHAAEARPARTAGPPKTAEDFKNDPLIQKALEVFKGQIVDVRS
jgi:DNA polymerase-3 subunit gamma/tau